MFVELSYLALNNIWVSGKCQEFGDEIVVSKIECVERDLVKGLKTRESEQGPFTEERCKNMNVLDAMDETVHSYCLYELIQFCKDWSLWNC